MNTISYCDHENAMVDDFLKRFNKVIMESCNRYKLNHMDCDAVCSEVLSKFFVTGKAELDSLKGNEEGYVRRIANNCACDIIRRRKNNMTDLDDPDAPEIIDAKSDFLHDMDMKELRLMLNRGLSILKKECRNEQEFAIFQKSFLIGEKRRDVSKEFGTSLYTVSAIQFRLKMKLEKIMTDILHENGWERP